MQWIAKRKDFKAKMKPYASLGKDARYLKYTIGPGPIFVNIAKVST